MYRRCLFLLLPLPLILWGFTPFTSVTTVCPACATKSADDIVLSSGEKLRCKVVAQNDEFYVLSRNGEYRAMEKARVSRVNWKAGRGPTNFGVGDQILTKSGIVFHGSIVEEKAGRYFVIQVGALNHLVWTSQIESLFRGGKLQPITH
jgi:hypothetical protein